MYYAVAPLGHFMSNLRAEESLTSSQCACVCVSLMSQSLLHHRWSQEVSRFSFPFSLSFFLLSLLLFPPSQPRPFQQTSLCGMHDIQLNNNHKKVEFRTPVVSMQGQLQTWISLQIKESLWGPNPVRHGLGRPYKGSTLNPLRVQLNEITPAMCDALWFFISSSLSLHLKKEKQRVEGWSHSFWNQNKYGVCPLFLSSSLPLSLPLFLLAFFPSSRWEAFRVLPMAESLTNVALKCNEVWNGSCGYNYPRTGAVTGMISLSLAIRMGCERVGVGEMERLGDRLRSHRVMSVCRQQTSGAFMDG